MRRDIPFTVEGIDLLETAEVRDLLAALRAMEGGDPVGLLRVSALPRFNVDGEGAPRGARSGRKRRPTLRAALDEGCGRIGSDHGAGRSPARRHSECRARRWPRAVSPKNTSASRQRLRRKASPQFVQNWSRKPRQVSGDGTLREFLEYLDYFIEADGKIVDPEADEDGTPATLQMEIGRRRREPSSQDDAVRLLTVHAAKGAGVSGGVRAAGGLHLVPQQLSRRPGGVSVPSCAIRTRCPRAQPKDLHRTGRATAVLRGAHARRRPTHSLRKEGNRQEPPRFRPAICVIW